MLESVMVDSEALREQVRQKYKEVATNPAGKYHFHTGRGSGIGSCFLILQILTPGA
jgi:hypothetical protein